MNLTAQDLSVMALLFGTIQFVAAALVKSKIESSIRHEYDQKLEEFRFALRKREQMASVAALLAMLTSTERINPREFNQLAWELSLWLPSDVVKSIRDGFRRSDEPRIKEILIDVRKFLNNGMDDGLMPEDILHSNATE